MTRGIKALAAVALVVVLIALGVRALGGDDEQARSSAPAPERSAHTVPAPPPDAPAEGMYVVSSVTEEGQVDVQTWVLSPTTLEELELTTTDPDLLPGSVESLDLVVRDLDGTVLARRDSIGTNRQRIRLRAPATGLYFSYTIDGAMDDASETVEGRTLARVLAMDVDYAGAGGVVRRMVTAPGTVLNVACLRPSEDFDAAPRPCGKATGDGDWIVDLSGSHRGDRLLAQLES